MPAKAKLLAAASMIGLACVATPAIAADVDSASTYDWSGAYVSIIGGMADVRARYEDEDYWYFGGTHNNNWRNAMVGMQAGYNWQDGVAVFGIESDISAVFGGYDDLFYNEINQQREMNWIATLRGRAGLAMDSSLFYVTGGLAMADFDGSWTEFNNPGDSWQDLGDTKLGIVGGVGFERAFAGNWSFKSEALIAHFAQNTSKNLDGFDMSVDDTVFMSRFGLSYHFGDHGNTVSIEGTPHDFAGLYAGVSAGAHMATISQSDLDYDWFGHTYDHESYGAVGGVQIGYNIQNGAAVHGIEASFVGATGSDSVTEDANLANYTSNAESGLNWQAALKLKTGVATGGIHTYLLGGLALADYDNTFLRDNGTFKSWDLGGTSLGLIVGGGMEYAVSSNLTARMEATYTALDGKTSLGSSATDKMFGHAQDFAVMAGLNYYLGDRSNSGNTGVIAPTTDWTGVYAGLQLGGSVHMGQRFDQYYDEDGGDFDLQSFGGLAGANIGADWQNGHYVFGAIADFALYSNSKSETSADPSYRTMSSDMNWMATLRARSGLATGNSLLYVTGGLAIADANFEHIENTNLGDSFVMDDLRFGGVGGVGVEHKLSDNLSLATEILYTRFWGSKGKNGEICDDDFDGSTFDCSMTTFDNNVTAKMSLNYRF
jgi:outer membrane immunogenic protein